jgi:hypothetical protein
MRLLIINIIERSFFLDALKPVKRSLNKSSARRILRSIRRERRADVGSKRSKRILDPYYKQINEVSLNHV